MHELSLCQSIIELVCRQAADNGARRVSRVKLAIGVLSDVEPDAITFCFDVASRDSLAEGAVLEIERPTGRARCLPCDAEITLAARGEPCPHCGGYRLLLTGGTELQVLELEVV